MPSLNNNKEFFELLDGSDSQSGSGTVQQLVIPPRKKRFRRRLRNQPTIRHDNKCSGRSVSVALLCTVLVCWLVALTWIAVVLYKEIVHLKLEVEQVAAAHQGVPDALHECHSLSRDLQKNQTAMLERLGGFSAVLANLSANLSDVRSALAAVQLQLKTSPSLVNDPRLVKDLSERVAEFGSKIQDLETTASGLKEHGTRIDLMVTSLEANVTDLRGELSSMSKVDKGVSAAEVAADKAALTARVDKLDATVAALNGTLSGRIEWTAEDQKKDHKAIEGLQEMNQNVTARLTTLEGSSTSPTRSTPPTGLFPSAANAPQQQQQQPSTNV